MSDTLLRIEDVSQRVSLGKTAIYEAIKSGRFPPQVKFGGAARWLESEIQTWIDCLKRVRSGDRNGDCPWKID